MRNLNRRLYSKRKFKSERGPYRYYRNSKRPSELYKLEGLLSKSFDYVNMFDMKYCIYQD